MMCDSADEDSGGSSSIQDSALVRRNLTEKRVPRTVAGSPPAQRRGDVLEDRLDDVDVVIDAELIWYRQQQRVGLGNGFVLLELFDQNVRLGGVAAAENGAPVVAEEADRVCALAVAAEIGAVAIVHQRKNAAADP